MALDPVAEEFLAQMAALGTPPMHTLTPEQMRATRIPPPPGPEVHRVEDMEAPGPDGPIPVRIYWPSQTQGDGQDLPALVWYHGGGWVIGNLESADATARRLATMADCVVVSVDYRLAPEFPYPAPLVDAYAAAVWTAQNAPRLGIDGARIALGGDSAGGNLAAVVARQLRDRGGPSVVHQLLVYPATDAARNTASYRENDRYLLTPEMMGWFYDHYCPDGVDRTQIDISPALAEDLAGLPPATVITAEFDPLRDEGMAYAAALEAAGVPVEAECYAGQIHTFFTAAHYFPAGMRATEAAAERLRAAFAA
ncbi:MAG: alpha/beta hydrolase [Dehalococcoidia bacterium]